MTCWTTHAHIHVLMRKNGLRREIKLLLGNYEEVMADKFPAPWKPAMENDWFDKDKL